MPADVPSLRLTAVPGIPLIEPGADLAALVLAGLSRIGERLQAGDALVFAQKIISKAEGRYRLLEDVAPGSEAIALAAETSKDPRLVELILGESRSVLRYRPGVLVVEHRLGIVLANAGIDRSNIEPVEEGERVLLLPEDPDSSARRLRAQFLERTGREVAIVINDSVGRAWRNGTAGLALGVAGLPPLLDLRGHPDLFGRALQVSVQAVADELAAAASLVQGQGNEGRPVVLVRGLQETMPEVTSPPEDSARALIRDSEEDLFR